MTTSVWTDAEIAERIAALDVRPPSKYVRPLRTVGESLIDALRVEDGIGLGLAQVDVLTRGFRPTDLVLITGFAHSGKTQLVNTMLCSQPTKNVLFFSLDDPAEMILAKLVAMKTGMSAPRIEAAVRADDQGVIRMVLDTATKEFPNLVIVDDVIGITAMQEAVAEATEMWGAGPHAIIVDYVEMMPGNGRSDDMLANVKEKLNDLKKWAKQAPYPVIVCHQGTRTNAHPGAPITLVSMSHSGEQQATIAIGVRRKRDDQDLDEYERRRHEDTITLHVVKNKRPGGRLTHYEGIDLTMNPITGMISDLHDVKTAAIAVQQVLGG